SRRWIDPASAVAAQNNRPDITGRDLVDAYELEICLAQLIHSERDLNAVDMRGIQEPLHVLAIPENCGALGRLIAADPLKNSRAVAHHMCKDVNFRVIPVDEFAVMPDFSSFREAHAVAPL